MAELEKVSRKHLRAMFVGQTKIFSMEPVKRLNVARVTCNQLKHEEGKIYRVLPDYQVGGICITRTK
jgi:hypothetical protein